MCIYSIWKNDSFVILSRKGDLVDSFCDYFMQPTSDYVHSSSLFFVIEKTIFIIIKWNFVFYYAFTFLLFTGSWGLKGPDNWEADTTTLFLIDSSHYKRKIVIHLYQYNDSAT